MPRGPEWPIENETVNRAEAAGYEARKVSWVGRRGGPDRLFIRPGRAVFIEFKAPGEEPTAQQQKELDRLRAAGLDATWADNVDDALRILGVK